MMNTIFAVLLLVFAVVFFTYLFRVLSEEEMNEKGKCDSEDYENADKWDWKEIANQVATRK